MTKDEAMFAADVWSSVYTAMSNDKTWCEHITTFIPHAVNAAGYKWEHDELACEDCNGQCKDCMLSKADHGRTCYDDGSLWRRVVHGDARAAQEISNFYKGAAAVLALKEETEERMRG